MNDGHGESEGTPVLVVGAGPTGLALACELCRRGISCRVVDKSAEGVRESRALGVQARTLELFQKLGIVEEVVSRGRKVQALNVGSGTRSLFRIDLSRLPGPYPFVLVIPQAETEAILERRLRELGCEVERSRELVSLEQRQDSVTAVVSDAPGKRETISARWLAGCDGAHSSVRHFLGVPFPGSAYEERFLLADVRIEGEPPHEAHLYLAEKGVAGIIPLPGQDSVRIVVALGREEGEQEPSLEVLRRALEARNVPPLVRSEPLWMSAFRIHRRIVPQYRNGRCFLLGDAAHIHSPVGGQGMNIGVQDGFDLGWKLGEVLSGRMREEVLSSYEDERRPVAEMVLRRTDRATRVLTVRSRFLRQSRDFLLPYLMSMSHLEENAARSVAELDIRYGRSLLIRDDLPGMHGLRPGRRVPDLLLADGRTLFDLLRRPEHLLLLFIGEEDLAAAKEIAALVVERFPSVIPLAVVPPGLQVSLPAEFLTDADGVIKKHFTARRDKVLFLIRPDGYLGYRGPLQPQEPFRTYLASIFH